MKSSFWLFFIIGILGIGIVTIGVLTFLKNNEPTTVLKPEVRGVMEQAEEKRNQAQEILSKETSFQDQQKARELLQESIDEAKRATQLQPNNPQTWLFLSKIYEQLAEVNPKNAVLAEEAVKKALELMPENPKILQELATMYIYQKKYKEAEEVLFKAIALDPTDPNVYFKLGNVYKSTGEKEKAKTNYFKAKELTPATHATNSAMIDAQLQSLEKDK